MTARAAGARIDLHRLCPRCGTEAVERKSGRMIVCRRWGLELSFNPCAAVAAIVLDTSDRVPPVRWAHEPARGQLAFPGGYVDDNETAEAALCGELREETGLRVDAFSYLLSHPNTDPRAGIVYQTFDQYFVARVSDFAAARPLDSDDRIVTSTRANVRLNGMAFESMKAAWRCFLATTKRDRANDSAEVRGYESLSPSLRHQSRAMARTMLNSVTCDSRNLG